MPLQATSGAASYDAFGGGVPIIPQYIEEVFSTYLYTGDGSTQTITNGIDLSGKGGLVWVKGRYASPSHMLFDTNRGVYKRLRSESTGVEQTQTNWLTAFNSNGFSVGAASDINTSSSAYASWTFRKQPKFFDVVTYTGNGTAGRTVAHNLGSVPGCVIVKRTDTTSEWKVCHFDGTTYTNLALNTTGAAPQVTNGYINQQDNLSPATTIQFDSYAGSISAVNANGGTYVAYLFASNAGGFGLTGTDNVISCGSYTESVGSTITLGYEPQYLLLKRTDSTSGWFVFDTMRGLSDSTGAYVYANTSGAEVDAGQVFLPQATGFKQQQGLFGAGANVIYIAIRRGPMKVPTSGTSVFGMSARTGTGANATVTGGQTDDAILVKNRGSAVASLFSSRLTGTNYLVTSSTAAQVAAGTTILQANPWDVMDGVKVGTTSTITNASSNTYINYLFKRAPSFMDVVCYTGTGANSTVTHNLQAVPELIICKRRDSTGAWDSYSSALANTEYVVLNTTAAKATGATRWNSTTPTSSVFSVGTSTTTNASAGTYIAFLFASCTGVSKVGSYTGTGTTLQIDCGFTAGARFVLIKRTDGPLGDWFVWDTARGIVSGNDPYLLLNSTDSEVTSTDYIDTYSAGFEISSTAPDALNINGGTFIFLAIA